MCQHPKQLQQAQELQELISNNTVLSRDVRFAQSLVDWVVIKERTWSEKQFLYVQKFLALPALQAQIKEERSEDFLKSFPHIWDMLYKASFHLEWPEIRVSDTLSIKYASQDEKILFLNSQTKYLLSRLSRGGIEEPNWGISNLSQEDLQKVQAIEDDVVGFAKIYGKETAHCCFCNLKLSNSISVYHGYGPICAKNFGLPWDKEKEEKEGKEL